MTTGTPLTGAALTAPVYTGRMPARAGDVAVETHGIAPVPLTHRYGTARRLFTVWFAPQFNLAVVFTGTLAATLGLGLWLGLLAVTLGTVLGSVAVAYLSTWGPRTGTAQLANARMAFGSTVGVVAVIQWLSCVGWDGLVVLFGGQALAGLVGVPFPLAALLVVVAQGVLGVFGYEVIHRVQAVMSVVLAVIFAVFAVTLLTGAPLVTAPAHSGADLAGTFTLAVAITLSLAISWAPFASDYSRYLPPDTPRRAVFGYTFAGLAAGAVAAEALGVAAAGLLSDQSTDGVRTAVGGGWVGALAMAAIAVGAVTCNVMNAYSGSLSLQAAGVRIGRPLSTIIVVALAFGLAMVLQAGDSAARFEAVLLFLSYWVPGFLAILAIDWHYRGGERTAVDPSEQDTARANAVAALVCFILAFLVAVPFMNTELIVGSVARAAHGADLAYIMNFAVAAATYGGYRAVSARMSR